MRTRTPPGLPIRSVLCRVDYSHRIPLIADFPPSRRDRIKFTKPYAPWKPQESPPVRGGYGRAITTHAHRAITKGPIAFSHVKRMTRATRPHPLQYLIVTLPTDFYLNVFASPRASVWRSMTLSSSNSMSRRGIFRKTIVRAASETNYFYHDRLIRGCMYSENVLM
ncbi:hypothetical protein EVAR_90243_1 [Eumeta japonica]|uniref:Uncharacterized protein n=1 Tax=Eumeta variegata TaxID=151549 RepID=A0A4C1YT55_EUMVA|nr:hypothetical protein EVAR_90243_1 [Eumeta japonica]